MPGYNHVKHMNVIALDGLIKIQVVIKIIILQLIFETITFLAPHILN